MGIALVAVFAATMNPNLSPNDNQLIASANQLPEAKVFLAQYPEAQIEVDRLGNYHFDPAIVYTFEKTYDDGRINDANMLVGLNTLTGMPSRSSIFTSCSESALESSTWSYWTVGKTVIETLETTKCAK